MISGGEVIMQIAHKKNAVIAKRIHTQTRHTNLDISADSISFMHIDFLYFAI